MFDVLVVGPAARETGGIARFIAEQRRHLPSRSLRIYDVSTPEGQGAAWFLSGLVSSVARMLSFPLRTRPDLVHVHTSHRYSFYLSSFYVLFAALVWRRPVILHVHGSSFDEFVESATASRRRFQSLVFGRCAAVVVLSAYWASVLEGTAADEKLVVMPNAVPASEFDPTFSATSQHLVFVSNLLARKGVPEFLTAIERLLEADAGPSFRVSIAGTGPLASDAAAVASRHDRVEYLGYVSETEKRVLLEDGTIYVLPSRAEGLPIALLEGMAAGNAVVATTVGSVPEVVGPEHGRLVAPGDVDALTAALRSLLGDPETVEAMGRRNRALVVDEYSWDARSSQLADLYRTLVNATGSVRRSELNGRVAEPPGS